MRSLWQAPPVTQNIREWTASLMTAVPDRYSLNAGVSGFASQTSYNGFYYSSGDVPLGFGGTGDMTLAPSGAGWCWEETEGDNWYYTERLRSGWYYYEMHF